EGRGWRVLAGGVGRGDVQGAVASATSPQWRARRVPSRPAGRRYGALLLLAFLLTGCPVGPNFVKPQPEMPPDYRSEITPAEAESFAALPWWDVFNDEILRGLIDESLANNYDLRTA